MPLRDPYDVSLPFVDERTLTPGAETLGLMIPSKADGPRDENEAMFPPMSNAPAAYVSGRSPGEPALPQPNAPSLPFENAGKMPDATHACTAGWKNGSPEPPPHELLTTSGRKSGRGLSPAEFVGARIHCPDEISAVSRQQPFAEIHFACGATPTWFAPGSPSSPTIVPIVCVPWPFMSQGSLLGHSSSGSHQL